MTSTGRPVPDALPRTANTARLHRNGPAPALRHPTHHAETAQTRSGETAQTRNGDATARSHHAVMALIRRADMVLGNPDAAMQKHLAEDVPTGNARVPRNHHGGSRRMQGRGPARRHPMTTTHPHHRPGRAAVASDARARSTPRSRPPGRMPGDPDPTTGTRTRIHRHLSGVHWPPSADSAARRGDAD